MSLALIITEEGGASSIFFTIDSSSDTFSSTVASSAISVSSGVSPSRSAPGASSIGISTTASVSPGTEVSTSAAIGGSEARASSSNSGMAMESGISPEDASASTPSRADGGTGASAGSFSSTWTGGGAVSWAKAKNGIRAAIKTAGIKSVTRRVRKSMRVNKFDPTLARF